MLLFQTPTDAPRWKRLLVYSPLARIVIFMVLAFVIALLPALVMKLLGVGMKDIPRDGRKLVAFAAQMLGAIGAYWVLVRLIEKRRFAEFPRGVALRQSAFGVACGAGLMTAVVAILAAVGSYRIEGFNPGASLVFPLLVAGFGAGISEEIIFRGVLYRITEEGLGTWWALGISGAFFGAVHLANDNATVWSSVAIAVEAGLLIGLVYHVTRSLWVCMGLHGGWNFFQGYVWGVPVSGNSEPGLVVSSRPGPDWVTGGAFGLEASVLCVLLNVVVVVWLYNIARRRGSLVPMKRNRAPAAEPGTAAA